MEFSIGNILGSTMAVIRDFWGFYGLRIHGIEVSQGIQHFHSDEHLVANFGPDNSLRLIAGKPAWVRVYVRSGTFPSIANVTGTLKLERRYLGFLWQPVATLSPRPPGYVTAFPDLAYDAERGNTNTTLNFVIPSDEMCGILRLTAHVEAPGGHNTQHSIEINGMLYQRLQIRGIMVGYDGVDDHGNPLTLDPPTEADLKMIGGWIADVFPVASNAHFSVGPTITFKESSTVKTGNWCDASSSMSGSTTLHDQIVQAINCDGNKPGFIYYALVAAGTPRADSAGCGGADIATGGAGESPTVPDWWDGTREYTAETTMTHELLHHLFGNTAHVGSCEGQTPDPTYPTYQSKLPGKTYHDASIGEYGININTGTIYPPSIFSDYRSYCERRWMSLYTWSKLIQHPKLNPSSVCVDLPLSAEEGIDFDDYPKPWQGRGWRYQPVISVTGILGPGQHLRIESVTRPRVAGEIVGNLTPYVVELLDEGGERLAAEVFRYTSHAGADDEVIGNGGAVALFTRLPDIAPGAVLRVVRNGEELWRREAPSSPPVIEEFAAEVTDESELAVNWSVRSPLAEDLHYWLRWSIPGEEDWHGLAIGLRGDEARVDLNSVLPGDALVQLVAHDGFFSVYSEPVSIVVPARPATATILSPFEHQRVFAGRTLRLFALASGGTIQRINADDYRWLIDGREVGRGPEVFVETPPPGEHRCTLHLELVGETVVEEVSFQTLVAPTAS